MAERIDLTDVMVTEPEEAMIRRLAAEWAALTEGQVNAEIEARFGGCPKRASIIFTWVTDIHHFSRSEQTAPPAPLTVQVRPRRKVHR